MIRQLSFHRPTTGDFVVLESGDWHNVDVDFALQSPESLVVQKHDQYTDNGTRTSQAWPRDGARGRLQIVQAAVIQLGRYLARLREQVWRECRSLAQTLRNVGLCTTLRGCLLAWFVTVADRISQWRRYTLTQRELWTTWLARLWVQGRHTVTLQWARLRLTLSQQLTAAQGSQHCQSTWRTWLRFAFSLLRICCSGCYSRITGGFHSLFTQCWRLVSGVGGYASQFPCHRLSSRFSVCGRGRWSGHLQGVCSSFSRGSPIQEDLAVLWTEPQGRALVVALVFAFATLGEIVAASRLPAWCASVDTSASHTPISDLMASATFSHSVAMSLKGAAAMV
ncbi:hypothetical protein ACOMHN_044269 [Nucella lapillus]